MKLWLARKRDGRTDVLEFSDTPEGRQTGIEWATNASELHGFAAEHAGEVFAGTGYPVGFEAKDEASALLEAATVFSA